MNLADPLNAEQFAEAGFLYVFNIGFPASLFRFVCFFRGRQTFIKRLFDLSLKSYYSRPVNILLSQIQYRDVQERFGKFLQKYILFIMIVWLM